MTMTIEGKGGITAEIVAHSVANDIPLITMKLKYPRFIHSEFMTHRMFSRNASSSRAIPVHKLVQEVADNPATPIHWGKNIPGMQAKEQLDNPLPAINQWRFASKDIVKRVDCLNGLGVHKQVANRLLEPFQFMRVVVTATEWDNFFNLRLHADAQPEIRELARVMQEAIASSNKITHLNENQFHLPFITDEEKHTLDEGLLIEASVARCARVSYLNHDKSKPDIDKDSKLFNQLLEAGHMSPFEHIAKPMRYIGLIEGVVQEDDSVKFDIDDGTTHFDRNLRAWSGNFKGWLQLRHLL